MSADLTPVPLPSAQAALFDDPDRLLKLSRPELVQLDALVEHHIGRGLMASIREHYGMLAWTHWHLDPEYTVWETETATMLGVTSRTLQRWRDDRVTRRKLRKPAVALQRSTERQGAGQTRYDDKMSNTLPEIVEEASPPASTRAPSPTRPLPRNSEPPQRPSNAPSRARTATALPTGDREMRRRQLVSRLVALADEANQLPAVEAGQALAAAHPGAAIKTKAIKDWATRLHLEVVQAAGAQVGGQS